MNTWEEKYKQISNIWGLEAEYTLKQYKELVNYGKVLDLGIGEGRNSLMFAINGHEIEGIDVSNTALKRCKDLFDSINCIYQLSNTNISNYKILKNNYSLIISTWALNFIKKSDALNVFSKAQKGLKQGGILYIAVFSKDDPQLKEYRKKYNEIDTDSYYIVERNLIKTYFDKSELLNLIETECEVISIKDGFSLDLGHGKEHYHGTIELLLRKKL